MYTSAGDKMKEPEVKFQTFPLKSIRCVFSMWKVMWEMPWAVRCRGWVLICKQEKLRRSRYVWIAQLSTRRHSSTHPTVKRKQQESLPGGLLWLWHGPELQGGLDVGMQATLWSSRGPGLCDWATCTSSFLCPLGLLARGSSLQLPTKATLYKEPHFFFPPSLVFEKYARKRSP